MYGYQQRIYNAMKSGLNVQDKVGAVLGKFEYTDSHIIVTH